MYSVCCLNTDHSALKALYGEARELPGIKKVLIGSGLRYDLALKGPSYIKELVTHHVGGYLKIAPELSITPNPPTTTPAPAQTHGYYA